MTDSEKLDRILKILNKQQQETYIPSKWKLVIDYLEEKEIDPKDVLEMFMLIERINKDSEKRLKKNRG